MCDASAAVSLGGGHFVVADDESDVLKVYRRGASQPLNELRLTRYLNSIERKTTVAIAGESDIEGAAAVGDRIYWISSHGRKRDGSMDPQRWRFFATDIDRRAPTPSVMPVAGKPYKSLLIDIATDPRLAFLKVAAELRPEVLGGLSIEGLAATPEGGMLIGFRNPQVDRKAVVLPMLNPADMVDRGAKPKFDEPIFLDLGGRGIRSMERVGNEYLIVAGPYGDAASSKAIPAFAMFRWSGKPQQAPELVRSLDFGSVRTEALFYDADANDLYLLSDDGNEQINGKDCKDKKRPAEEKFFRGRAMGVPK
ncbi:DUF3616 domain-containing protein [Pigmentiphaga aceris]|nr:DUF3616 domain-containing protein [Pigmentiphaga aceris]